MTPHMHDAHPGPRHLVADAPPETIDDAPLTVGAASALMARLGFVAFRTPPGARIPDSCLMALLRDAPTLAHFDPEVVSYWTIANGHGRPATVDLTTRPALREFSWGRIQISDRLGMRNSFVTFGGQLTTEAIGAGIVLAIFRSPAPILRLPGHSQHGDRLAAQALAFFGRLVPHLWASTMEAQVGRAAADVLWAAFLIHEQDRRIMARGRLGDGDANADAVWRGLRELTRERPEVVAAGRRMLEALGLLGSRVERRG